MCNNKMYMLKNDITIQGLKFRVERKLAVRMSVFRGSITEYPGVIVDHFVPSNCDRGRAFFLSHCHKDHMTGLSSPALSQVLQSRQTSLYCSEVTQSLLLKDPEFSSLSPYLKPLPMEYPVAMALEGLHDLPPLSLTVTLLPAGHCPGSAMFLFQGSSGNVLYTGDFRLTLEETQRLQPLHSNGSLIELATVYLDTTFCHPTAVKLPSRAISRDYVIKIMEKWLSSDECNVVRLHCSSFGYEHIYMGVATRLKTKVHIARWKIQAYADLPAVRDCLTSEGSSTRVHNCNFRRGATRRGMLPCGSVPVKGTPRVLHIKPSTLWFVSNSHPLSEPSVFFPKFNSYRVLHSMHASYTEVCQFVSYLKPRRVVPCVVPVGDATLRDVHARLKVLLPHSQISSDIILSSGDDAPPLSRRERRGQCSLIEEDKECEENDSSSDEAPHHTLFTPFSSSSQLSTEKVALPSMMASHASSSGVIAAPVAGSSGNTSDSLEQTPLDLSLDGSESNGSCGPVNAEELITSAAEIETDANASAAEVKTEVKTDVKTEAKTEVKTEVKTVKTTDVVTDAKTASRGGQTSVVQEDGCRQTDTHRTKLDAESKKERRLAYGCGRQTLKDCHLPPCKRSKLGDTINPTPSAITPRKLFHSDCEITEQPIEYIDLTQDDSPDKNMCLNSDHQHTTADHHHTLNKAHHSRDSSLPPVLVVSSSDSSQPEEERSSSLERFSPDILPPTPGREEVDSILQRKKLTVL